MEGHGLGDAVEDDEGGAGGGVVELGGGGGRDGLVGANVGELAGDLGWGGAEGQEAADDAGWSVLEVEHGDVVAVGELLGGGDEGEPGLARSGFAGDGVDGAGVEEVQVVAACQEAGGWVDLAAFEGGVEVEGCPAGVGAAG